VKERESAALRTYLTGLGYSQDDIGNIDRASHVRLIRSAAMRDAPELFPDIAKKSASENRPIPKLRRKARTTSKQAFENKVKRACEERNVPYRGSGQGGYTQAEAIERVLLSQYGKG